MNSKDTTMVIKKDVKKKLDNLKVHKNQSYSEVVDKLIQEKTK